MITNITCGRVALVVSALLAGCQTPQQTASLQCGAGAAAAGYLLCKATGGSDAQCLRVAAVVGVGGGAICYAYANNLEKRRKQLAGHEEDVNAQLQYVKGLNSDAEQLNADLRNRVATAAKHTDELVAQVQARRVSQDQLAREREALDNEVKSASAQVKKGNDALKEVRVLRTKTTTSAPNLDEEIRKQEVLLADAQRQVDQLSAQRARV